MNAPLFTNSSKHEFVEKNPVFVSEGLVQSSIFPPRNENGGPITKYLTFACLLLLSNEQTNKKFE